MSARFPISYELNVRGAEDVKGRLEQINNQFRQGQLTTRNYTKGIREIIRDTNTFNRSIDLQSRLFFALHPRLNLTIRAMSSLASVARIGQSIFDSLNILQIALSGSSSDLRDAQKEAADAQFKYNEAVAAFGPDSQEAIDALEDLREAQNKLNDVVNQNKETINRQIINLAILGVAALAVIPQLVKLRFMLGALFATLPIPLPVLGAIAAGLAIFALLWFTNLFNTRTALEAWGADTKSRLDAWFAETTTLFKDWSNLSGGEILVWALNTIAGISEWILDSLFGFTEWASDAIDIFSKWSDDVVEIMTTGTFDKMFSDKQMAILFEKANLVGAGINNAIVAALQAGFKGSILEPFFNDLRTVSEARIQEIKNNIERLRSEISEEVRRQSEISSISFGKDVVSPSININQGKIAKAFKSTTITFEKLENQTKEVTNELEKAVDIQDPTNEAIEEYKNRLDEIAKVTNDTIDASKDTDDFIKSLESGYDKVTKLHTTKVLPATQGLAEAEAITTLALLDLENRIRTGFFTKKGRFIPGGSQLPPEVPIAPSVGGHDVLAHQVNVIALDFAKKLLTIEHSGRTKSLTQAQFDQFDVLGIFSSADKFFKQSRLHEVAAAIGLQSAKFNPVTFAGPTPIVAHAGETLASTERFGGVTYIFNVEGSLLTMNELMDVIRQKLGRGAVGIDRTL